MSLKITNTLDIHENGRLFNSYANIENSDINWYFKYITLDTNNEDQTITNHKELTDKISYPVDTIFLDGDAGRFKLTSNIVNIIIDTTPPEFYDENISYLTINKKHKCKITFKSDTQLDVRQLIIATGDIILYKVLRKDDTIEVSNYISDVSMERNNDLYILSFTLDSFLDTILNENQINIIVWDLAANKCIYETGKFVETDKKQWIDITPKEDVPFEDTLEQLKIEFIDINPINKVLGQSIIGKVKVKVSNPNENFWAICPTVELGNNSIGYLDKSTIDYNPETGVLVFYVNHIKTAGDVIINAWLNVNNNELNELIKYKTYNTNTLSDWILTDPGRLYNLKLYLPKYLNDEYYNDFLIFTELYLNTCQKSLTTNNNIGILEKIARIGDFNNSDKIEALLLDHYSNTFNFELKPKYEDFVRLLNAHLGSNSDDK